MVNLILTILLVIVCVVLVVIVLMQEGKSAGLTGSISGTAETYWSKNRGRSAEGALEKFTKFLAIAFVLLAIALNIGFLK